MNEKINIIKRDDSIAVRDLDADKKRKIPKSAFGISIDKIKKNIGIFSFKERIYLTEIEKVTIQDGDAGTPVQLTTDHFDSLTDGLTESAGGSDGNSGSGGNSGRLKLFAQKNGINSAVYPLQLQYPEDITVSNVVLAGNATGAKFRIGYIEYDEVSIIGKRININSDFMITDINIAAGYNAGSILIIF